MIIVLISMLIWGWLNQNWLAAFGLCVLVLCHYVSSWRWILKPHQFYRVGDFVTGLFVVAILYFSLVQTEQQPVFLILEWLPAFFLPILLVQLYSGDNRLPIGTLFYSLRNREKPSYLDFKYPYAAICLLGAGAAHNVTYFYFAVSIAVFSAILWSVRSKNSSVVFWFFAIAIAALLSFWGQQGLRQLQRLVEEQSLEWLSEWHTDPFKRMTSIGDIGELKLSDKIEFRVDAQRPLLLLQASYDRFLGQSWFASNSVFSDQPNYTKAENSEEIKKLQVFQSRKSSTILALPSGTVDITGLEGGILQFTPLGAVKLSHAPDFVNFQVSYTGRTIKDEGDFDLQIPKKHLTWITKIKQELNLDNKPPQVIAKSIIEFFQQNYYYSLYLGQESDADKALENFMLKGKSGHCEYFAVASTLLLRSYGIPSRLANGYAMQEYSELEQLFIVRRRHSHAWSIAYIDGVWQEVDSTPYQWLDMEEEHADALQPVYDFFSLLYFNYKQWRYQQFISGNQLNSTVTLGYIAAFLLLILLWRLYRVRKNLLKIPDKLEEHVDVDDKPGQDSELYLIEQTFSGTDKVRLAQESIINWARRINSHELMHICKLHNQYRFDNDHFSVEDRVKLKKAVQQWMQGNG